MVGFQGGESEGLSQTTMPSIGANGAWTAGAAPIPSGDGTYVVTAFPNALPGPVTSETVILAQMTTPFSAVGLAFIDMNTGLSAAVVPKAGIYRDLTAEVAGLTVLHQDGLLLNQPFNKLIKDINAEISTLDFKAAVPNVSAANVAKLVTEQGAIHAYVASTPALVALQPAAGVAERGW